DGRVNRQKARLAAEHLEHLMAATGEGAGDRAQTGAGHVEDVAADQVGDIDLVFGERRQLVTRQLDRGAAQRLRAVAVVTALQLEQEVAALALRLLDLV